jgi:hypothetical protein
VDFLEENEDAVRALARNTVVKNNNGGGKHRRAGSELWDLLGFEGQAHWQCIAALKAR